MLESELPGLVRQVLWASFGLAVVFGAIAQRTHFCTMGAAVSYTHLCQGIIAVRPGAHAGAAYNPEPARLASRMPTLPERLDSPWSRRRAMAALGSLAAGPAAAQFRVQITGVGATQIPVALAALRDESASGVAVSAIVRADLERSGLFRVLPAEDNLDERSNVDLAAWRGRGADALVAGSVTRLADGRLDVRCKLWDAVRNEQLLGQSKVVLAGDLRLAAHRVADEIHEKLTGERGVNATRIAYVIKAGRRFTLHITCLLYTSRCV